MYKRFHCKLLPFQSIINICLLLPEHASIFDEHIDRLQAELAEFWQIAAQSWTQ